MCSGIINNIQNETVKKYFLKIQELEKANTALCSQLLIQLKKWDLALSLLEILDKDFPPDQDVFYRQGLCLFNLKCFMQSTFILWKGMFLFPKSTKIANLGSFALLCIMFNNKQGTPVNGLKNIHALSLYGSDPDKEDRTKRFIVSDAHLERYRQKQKIMQDVIKSLGGQLSMGLDKLTKSMVLNGGFDADEIYYN